MIILDAGHGAYFFRENDKVKIAFQRPLLYIYKQKLQFLGSFSFQSLDTCFEKDVMNIENFQKENFLYREDFGTLEIVKYLKKNSRHKDKFILSREKIFDVCDHEIFPSLKKGARECILFRVEKIREIEDRHKTNKNCIDLILSIHSNACSDLSFNQIEILYYSKKGKMIAEKFKKHFEYFEKTKLIQRRDLAILKYTKSPAILIECFYHTNPQAIRRFFYHIDIFKELIDNAIADL